MAGGKDRRLALSILTAQRGVVIPSPTGTNPAPTTETEMTYEFKNDVTLNGHKCNVSNWSGNFRPFRGVVINSDGVEVAHTGGCSSKSRALDRAVALARTL